MAKYLISNLKEDIATRKPELAAIKKALLNGKDVKGNPLAKNTLSTKRSAVVRDEAIIALIEALVKEIKVPSFEVSDLAYSGLQRLFEPKEFVAVSITVNEGDSILTLLDKYQSVKDIGTKLSKAAEKAGLKVDYKSGKIVKA